MKTVKSILIAITLICATVVSSMSAQQAAQPAQPHEFQLSKGDTVMIKRECERYLTGERPSVWVWDKVHTVRQLGTKRFSDGVLLMNIYSWMCEDCLTNVNGHAKEAEEKAKREQAAEKAAYEQAAKDGQDPQAAAAKAAAEKAAQDSIAAAAAEQARQDSIAAAQAALEEAKRQQAIADSIAAAEEQARQDSIEAALKEARRGYNRFTIGLRGGASALLHNVDNGKWICGGDAILDLQYAHYWRKENRPVDLGLIIGLGLGYSQSGMKANVNTQTTYEDKSDPTFPMHVDYNVRADEVKEADGQLQLEIPIMFSLISEGGIFFNIGPKFMLPVYTPYKQTISNNENTYIAAYFQEISVPVTNEVITGMLAEDQYVTKATDNGNQFSINIMLGAELGYEWTLKSGNSFGLGVYANYCVFNSFKNNTDNIPLIEVTPPQGDEVASVDVHSATKTYAKGLGYFDAGLKLAYHFNFPKKSQKKADKE